MPSHYIAPFGEILYDRFEDGLRLGGAPLNFAWNLRQLGFAVTLISAVGSDDLGREMRWFLEKAGIDQTGVLDRPEPTGTVDVHLVDGEPEFTINEQVAWDYIELPSSLDMAKLDMVYFGTAAQRTAQNRAALHRLLDGNPRRRFYDPNLRPHHCWPDIVLDGLDRATIVKLSEAEWDAVRQLTHLSAPGELLDRFALEAVAVTRGAEGAELYVPGGVLRNPGTVVTAVNPVGAGDTFSAVLAAGIMRQVDPGKILEAACAAGAAVVQQEGAQIVLPDDVLAAIGS